MTDYIDRAALTEQLLTLATRYAALGREKVAQDYNWVITVLDSAPAADVAEVVLAQWEEADWREYDAQSGETICYPKAAIACTNCRCAFKKDALWSRNYCPNCGAKMDGDNDNAAG